MLTPLILFGMMMYAPRSAARTVADSASGWSAPTNLGAVVNSASSDQQPAISPDGLSLYFTSNRVAGSLGGFDMYVSRRASVNDPWGAPVNVGALNTASDEGNPTFSRDGRSIFFQSKRTAGSLGGIDIWVARRDNPHDDFGWQPAANLGANVNSTADDQSPYYFEDVARGTRQLYFASARPGLGGTDIYVSEQAADGSFAPSKLVTELSSASNEADPTIRHDGLEIIFQSNRAGTNGTANDLWVATRASTLDAWSTPVNLGGAINTTSAEQNAYLSSDGAALFFTSDRPGGAGLDLYTSTRTLPTPSWGSTGNLNAARRGQTATLLPNGKVLVAGGYVDVDVQSDTRTAELYDPATGTWSSTGHLNVGRFSHTATLLPDMNASRSGHTATLLQDGRVLVAGGALTFSTAVNSAELYDPATGTWSLTGSLNTSRTYQTATLLQNGKVLVAGGYSTCSNSSCPALNSAELYDPASGAWSLTGNLNFARYNHTATLLPDGTVLVAGFFSFGSFEAVATAELYDPITGTWKRTGDLNAPRGLHTATLLPNGKVLVAAGASDGFGELNSAELDDPATGTWKKTADLNEARDSHSATLLPNGRVLV
ncbi:MAG: hypothetical protein LC746_04670, partial [Acidobacteria bacterium]|nr:hypothetical protein [Acidobacteriota bacterium]